MSEKKLTTRIQQKTDTKANWDKATNFVPLKGEYIYYSDLHKVKVGDGVTKVGSLPFLADSNTHQSIKALNTNNTSAQTVSSSEAIAGSGTINLHKVAKTGSYNDLNNKPTIPTVPKNIVKYTEATAEVAGTNKTVAAVSPSALYVANGLIMGGTAAAAGLVTRGICGVMTPDSTGACTKENLYLNYDGDNNYLRKVVLGAGSDGDSIAGGATTFSAVRGDQMVNYVNSLALIKSGKQTTTSTADGGSNVYTFTDTKGNTSTFTVKNGSKGSTGAHISSVTGDKTPAAGNTVTYTMKNTDGTTAGTFKVVNGTNGSNGSNGAAAGFGTPTASVDANVGTPSVTVTASGSNTAKVFNFAFKNLKGQKGDTGATGSVAGTTPAGSGNVVTDVSLDPSTKKLTITKNKTLATVATSGSYNDLLNKPTIPTVTGKLDKDTSTAFTLYGTGPIAGDPTKMWPVYHDRSATITVGAIPSYTSTAGGSPALYGRSNQTEDSTKMSVIEDNELPTYKFVKSLLSNDAKLDSANTFTAANTFKKSITINTYVSGSAFTNPDIIMSNGSDQTKYGMDYLWHNGTTFNFPAWTGGGTKTLATTADISSKIKDCLTTSTIELVSYTYEVNIETNRVTEVYLNIEGMDSHAWDKITIDLSAAVSGGSEINNMTNFYYDYMGTKTLLRLTGPNVASVHTDGYLMQFTINNDDHILVRGKAIKLEDNKNTLFISQDPAKLSARLYLVDNSRIGYTLQLVGPQDLSNYVEKDLINLSSSTSLIKTNRLYIKDSSYAGNKVMTADDVHLYEHRIQLRQLESTPQSGSVDTIGNLVLYSKYNTVINSAEKLYKILQQEITYLSGPTVMIRYTDIDNPTASAEPCTTIVHYTDSSGNGRYRFGGYNGASYSSSGGVISVYEDTVRTIR